MAFALSAGGRALPDAIALTPADAPAGNWPKLAMAAIASGAFPVGLQARDLDRPHADYRHRFDRPPEFGDPVVDPYRLLAVDGGLMDNEPLELARRHLAGGPPGTNPRAGDLATRAVLMVDPFPNRIAFDPAWHADDRLVRVIGAMFTALINQARFKPEELALAERDDVFSRFMISPSRTDADGAPLEPAMTAAILGGFGAFLHEDFRRHDFQLGRRNCQAFLRWHFRLPESNPLFAGLADAQRAALAIRERDGRPVAIECARWQPGPHAADRAAGRRSRSRGAAAAAGRPRPGRSRRARQAFAQAAGSGRQEADRYRVRADHECRPSLGAAHGLAVAGGGPGDRQSDGGDQEWSRPARLSPSRRAGAI